MSPLEIYPLSLVDTTSTVLQLHLRGYSWTTLTRFCIFMTTLPSVLLLVPPKSNEYQYLKCTAISISTILWPVSVSCQELKYFSVLIYFSQSHFINSNMHAKNRYFIFIFWRDHVWQLDEVESFLLLHKQTDSLTYINRLTQQ